MVGRDDRRARLCRPREQSHRCPSTARPAAQAPCDRARSAARRCPHRPAASPVKALRTSLVLDLAGRGRHRRRGRPAACCRRPSCRPPPATAAGVRRHPARTSARRSGAADRDGGRASSADRRPAPTAARAPTRPRPPRCPADDSPAVAPHRGPRPTRTRATIARALLPGVRLRRRPVRLPRLALRERERLAGRTPTTPPPRRTASRRRCPARRWPPPAPTGRPTRSPRSAGAWATSRTATARPCGAWAFKQGHGWY